MTLALVLSATLVVASSYAWLVLSGNPAVTGIQVAVGGGNTILTAPDIRYVTEEGTIYHFPGSFSDTLNFGQQTDYDYLQKLGNLTPVSTSNGVDWFIPTYYSGNDKEVQEGKVPTGTLRDISEFIIDSELLYANLDPEVEKEKNMISKGSYIYLDFWVVAPGGDYKLRVSTGTGTADSGSFVIDLPEPEETESGYTLGAPRGSAAAAVRVGFLANDLRLIDDTMSLYEGSKYFDNRFTALKGMYQESETGTAYLDANRFTIYEPNADYHPAVKGLDGMYKETRPLGLVSRQILEQEISDCLTIQKVSDWAPSKNGETAIELEQKFQASLFSLFGKKLTEKELFNSFYGSYLQGQLSPYVNKGAFVANTGYLYKMMDPDGVVSQDKLISDKHHGATDDVYIIQLERNVPQRIRMFIWLEGQDIDCVDSVNSVRFAVNIELAGGDE